MLFKVILILEKELLRREIEEICQSEDSDYKKFYNRGFPQTAKDAFDDCMQKL